jgi:WD40 repeat protein
MREVLNKTLVVCFVVFILFLLWMTRASDFSDLKLKSAQSLNEAPLRITAFSPESEMLTSSRGEERAVEVRDLRNPLSKTVLRLPGEVTALAFSPDGQTLAVGQADDNVRLLRASKWDFINLVGSEGNSAAVTALAFSPQGTALASGGADGKVKLWSTRTFNREKILGQCSGSVRVIAFATDGMKVAAGCDKGKVLVWSVSTGSLEWTQNATGAVLALAFSFNGRVLASAGEDKDVRFWDIDTGAAAGKLEGPPESVTTIAFAPGGKELLTGSRDGKISVWDFRGKKSLVTLGPHFAPVVAAQPLITFTAHDRSVIVLAFLPDRETLVTLGEDGELKVWRRN